MCGGSVGNIVSKATSVVTSAASGFVGGGGIGSIAGAVKGVVANTQTSKAAPTTLKSVGTDVAIGAVSNIAAGAVATGVHALSVPTLAGGSSAIGKATAFLKGGGVSTLLKQGASSLIKEAPAALAAIKGGFGGGSGATPGTTATDTASSVTQKAQSALSGYGKFRSALPNSVQNVLPDTASIDTSIRNAVGDQLRGIGAAVGPNTGETPGTVQEASVSPMILLAGAALLIFFLVKKH